jgi:SAM-dependent methyltransferase
MTCHADYSSKGDGYFTGERRDLIDRLDPDPDRAILEIGCGDGATGAYAKRTGKCGRYVGIELFPRAAESAAGVLDEVHVGDIERIPLPFAAGAFDVLIASEVLEHLVDPWAVLRRLQAVLRSGAVVFASSPNIAHRSTFKMLLAGRWDLDPDGRMDRTHLRWFTPITYAEMFRSCGYDVRKVEALVRPGPRARLFNVLTANRFAHLFMSQIVIEARAGGSANP